MSEQADFLDVAEMVDGPVDADALVHMDLAGKPGEDIKKIISRLKLELTDLDCSFDVSGIMPKGPKLAVRCKSIEERALLRRWVWAMESVQKREEGRNRKITPIWKPGKSTKPAH